MTQILSPSLLDILHQHSRNIHDAQILYDNLAQYLQPLFIRLSLQSKAEYILLCQRLHIFQLDPFQAMSNLQNDTIFMFLQGKLVLDSSEYDELDAFDTSYKQIKKNKLQFQRQLNVGYIAENKYILKIFALETSYLLYVTKQSQQLLTLKHEQFIRQKRTFFLSLFQPTTQAEKIQIQFLSDQLILKHYSDTQKIFTIYQPLESMFIVYQGQVELRTKRNLLCTCTTFDTFNEDCNSTFYTAQVKEQAEVFEITKAQYLLLPQKAQEIIEMRAKSKQNLRKSLLDHHIIDLQVPEITKTMKYERLTPKRKNLFSLTSVITCRASQKKLNTDTSITMKTIAEADILIFDFEEFETTFEARKKQIEQRIIYIQKSNDSIIVLQNINQEQLRHLKQEMKVELQELKQLISELEIKANRDQKFQLKQLKQKIIKCEEQHKMIIAQLVKQSISEQFDRLSLQDIQNLTFEYQSLEKSKNSSIPNSLPTEQVIVVQSKKQSKLSQSLQQPLVEPEIEETRQQSNSNDSEEQVAQQLNQQYVEYQQLKVEQENLQKYNQEIDQLVKFDQNDKRCFKYSIISAMVLIIMTFLYSSIWLCNTIYEMIYGIEQLLYQGVQLGIIICYLILQYIQKSKQQVSFIIPILLLMLNITIILQQMNPDRIFLFLLPIFLYEPTQKKENQRIYFKICKSLHLLLIAVWRSLYKLENGQPIILVLILIIFLHITSKDQPKLYKRNETDFEDTINMRTNSDTDRISDLQNQLLSIIKLDNNFNLAMFNAKAQNLLKNVELNQLLKSPVLTIDKQTKILLQDTFSYKFPSFQDLRDYSSYYTLKELLEHIKQIQKYPYEFTVFSIKGFQDLLLQIYYVESKSFTIVLQNLDEYNFQMKKQYTQTTMQQLFRSFSHEYNTSLNYILALAQVAESSNLVPANIQEQYFKPILVNGKVMHSMILDMMDYNSILGKTFTLQVGNCNIKELMNEVISLFQDQIKKKNLEIKIINNSEITEILSDKNRIKQVLVNLVSNAQKFTLHGTITLKVETILNNQKKQLIIFHVEDTGIGMNKEEQEKLINLLQSGVPSINKISQNTAGFGLGLFVSNKIAEALSQLRFEKGGGLRFETQPDQGFHCWFAVYHQIVSPSIKSNNPKSPLIILNKKMVIDTRQTEVSQGLEQLNVEPMRSRFSHLLNNGSSQTSENTVRQRRPHNNIRLVQELMDAVEVDIINKECSIDEYHHRIKYIKSQGQQLQQSIFLRSNQSIIECRCPSILIVDDEQINILALSLLLDQLGLTSDQVFNGKECVDLIFTKQKKTYCSKCSDKQYQLIFMDINMPLMNGWEASRKIKQRFQPAIIACTAFTDNETKEQCYQNGIDYYISKPVRKESLIQVLQYYHIL